MKHRLAEGFSKHISVALPALLASHYFMHLGILPRINRGYDGLEPIILGLMAMQKSFMLIGRHGTGKSRLARILSLGHGGGFAFYDATKDDLISIAGIPDVRSLTDGALRFVPHERSIWNKTTIVVDEITRAGKESQNLWLEILEDHTCFGLPLSYRTLIATANPESYAAAFQLDEALLDRFHAVLPVPEMQDDVTADDVAAMVELASASTPQPTELARVFLLIQRAHAELLEEGARARVTTYVSKLVPELFAILARSERRYVSARTYARHLPETILAVAAYFRAAGVDEPLRRGAGEAMRYALAAKLQIKPAALEQLHRTMEGLLGAGTIPDADKLRLEFSGLDSFDTRLSYLVSNWDTLLLAVRPDEMEKMLGTVLLGATARGDRERLVELRAALARVGYSGDAVRQVDAQLILTFRQAMAFVSPQLGEIARSEDGSPRVQQARASVRWFLEHDARGSLLPDHSAEAVRLKRYVIDAYEGDVPSDRDALVTLFADLPDPCAG